MIDVQEEAAAIIWSETGDDLNHDDARRIAGRIVDALREAGALLLPIPEEVSTISVTRGTDGDWWAGWNDSALTRHQRGHGPTIATAIADSVTQERRTPIETECPHGFDRDGEYCPECDAVQEGE